MFRRLYVCRRQGQEGKETKAKKRGSLLIKVPRSENRLYKAQLKVGKEDTNEVGRESGTLVDKEVNPHQVIVHNPVLETSPESEKDNSGSDDTPNPLVRLETIRLLIALAARKG
ncbi:hypothetical protein Tco_0863349 [Tanacetum coccineum]